MDLTPGLYDQIVSELLDRLITARGPSQYEAMALDVGDSHSRLAKYLHPFVANTLKGLAGEQQERICKQIALCNRLLHVLQDSDPNLIELNPAVAEPAKRLLEVFEYSNNAARPNDRPDTPLATGCLLTGTRLDPSLVSQLKKEIKNVDRIEILCSFIKWSGVRLLEDELKFFTAKPGSQLRVITTSYMGATDPKAVEFLRKLPNTELRISYDTHRTRLHAKAYIFRRASEFGSAYIGSANLSHAALTDGLEWNVKISQYESPHLWEKITATFETYWNDAEFYHYGESDRPRLEQAIEKERLGQSSPAPTFDFDLNPYAFQKEILQRLEAEREIQGRSQHLVVAATGTGKTMIAAFDYRSWCRESGAISQRPRLLFIAHREEILRQSLFAFRAVLRDQNFGDLLVGGERPDSHDFLFVSIQSYNARELWKLPSNFFAYVVLDEFHHAAAPSYTRLLDHVRPNVLLGLTATPERADGLDILKYFGGHISAEIRLPDAINRKLLCPFQYFGVTDAVDFSGLKWERGGYRIDELNRILTGNDLRANLIIEKVAEKLLDIRQACGLGFCVSVAHALYMAEQFRRHDIPAEALSGESNDDLRRTIQDRLRRREINFIFVVDLYNEGIDMREVDTIIFMRPTESLTVFLQQLGRGLRLHDEKECLTVFDFIGQAHRNFRFDVRYRALLNDPVRSVDDQIEQGFPHLPAGCFIQLERVARQFILENIRQTLRQNRHSLVREIKTFAQVLGRKPTLSEFLNHYRLDIDDVYRRGVCWNRLLSEAGAREQFDDPDEERLTRGLRRIEHLESADQIRKLVKILTHDTAGELDETSKRLALMLHFSLWGHDWKANSIAESILRVRTNTTMCSEIVELLQYKLFEINSLAPELRLPFPCPLTLHARYTRDEVLTALGHWSLESQPELREGVLHISKIKADILLVTLDKTERDYSPTTMYEDYAISNQLFHWQSQSQTSESSPTGQRYINQNSRGQTILLFVRECKRVNNLAAPYHFLGPVKYQSHVGTCPISIVWELFYQMPAKLLRYTGRLAIA